MALLEAVMNDTGTGKAGQGIDELYGPNVSKSTVNRFRDITAPVKRQMKQAALRQHGHDRIPERAGEEEKGEPFARGGTPFDKAV